MSPRLKLYCLHGFLGHASDWDALTRELPEASVEAVDVFAFARIGAGLGDMAEWGERFAAWVAQDARNAGAIPVLLGYSMGGRLAMHALLAKSGAVFRAGILVSASPGMQREEEKAARLQADEAWARRFESEPWAQVLADWNAQPVFGGVPAPELERKETKQERRRAALCLRDWSVAKQEDLLPRLCAQGAPLLWMAGERDRKYAELVRDVAARGVRDFQTRLIEGAGHRVPWERPAEFRAALAEFLRGVS